MTIWVAGVWGLLGGLCVELLELYANIRRTGKWNWRKPIQQGLGVYLLSVACRVGIGAIVAGAAVASAEVVVVFRLVGVAS